MTAIEASYQSPLGHTNLAGVRDNEFTVVFSLDSTVERDGQKMISGFPLLDTTRYDVAIIEKTEPQLSLRYR